VQAGVELLAVVSAEPHTVLGLAYCTARPSERDTGMIPGVNIPGPALALDEHKSYHGMGGECGRGSGSWERCSRKSNGGCIVRWMLTGVHSRRRRRVQVIPRLIVHCSVPTAIRLGSGSYRRRCNAASRIMNMKSVRVGGCID
jgi:hypothetical protein